jgi:membrane peptidoglycan carboxypeptidase
VQTPDLGTTRSFPDPDLARTLSHALQRLDRSFRNRLLQPHGWVDGGVELVTTLDSDVQRALDRAIEQGATEGGVADVERLRGAAIVLDATDGSILALESRPSRAVGGS